MKTSDVSNRFKATPELRHQFTLQGRKACWAARQIGVSKSLMSRVMSGHRTIGGQHARVVAALLGVDFFSVFEYPNGNDLVPFGRTEDAA